jgi:hypothetical protein
LNKLILIPLLCIIAIAFFVQFYALGTVNDSMNGNIGYNETGINGYNGTNGQGQLDLSGLSDSALTLSLTVGFLALFIGMLVTGILIGLDVEVLGSTIKLSERSQKLAFNGLFYGGLWGLFSVLATVGVNGYNIGLFSVPIGGIIIYAIMTLFYILGINEEMNK